MNRGISVFGNITPEEHISQLCRLGITHTFFESKIPELHKALDLCKQHDIICDTLHAPFDGINGMWDASPDGDQMLNRLTDTVEICSKYEIPITIIHVSSGRPMPTITDSGLERYHKLAERAESLGVKLAFENLRYTQNLQVLLDEFPQHGFCWDTGHENCFTDNVHFMEHFVDRLIALHIHDNRLIKDSDDHYVPYDGTIDFERVAEYIAASKSKCTLMLEVNRNAAPYTTMSHTEYYDHAFNAITKLAETVDKYLARS